MSRVGLVVAALLAAGPVHAGWSDTAEAPWGHAVEAAPLFGPPGPDLVLATLDYRGFTAARIIRGDGRRFVVTATDPRGNRVRMTVDGRTGKISRLRQTHWTPYVTGDGEEPVFYPHHTR